MTQDVDNKKHSSPVNTSGWTETEIAMLNMLKRQDGTDASKLIRALVRKEYDSRLRIKKIKAQIRSTAV